MEIGTLIAINANFLVIHPAIWIPVLVFKLGCIIHRRITEK